VLAEKLICNICGDDKKKWKDAEDIAIDVIQHRGRLWDGVLEKIQERKEEESSLKL